MISLDYKNAKPLHEQIRFGIRELIIAGSLKKDEQLPSVRDLSVSLTVNPNTVARAYKDLEAEGLVYSIQGRGSFVSGKVEKDSSHIKELYAKIESISRELLFLGEEKKTITNVIDNIERDDIND